MSSMFRKLPISVPCLLLFFGCVGDGSDIGPKLNPLPAIDYRVMVQDDEGRPVCGALVKVAGFEGSAATGRLGRAKLVGRPSGVRLLTVEGSNGSATTADLLGGFVVEASMPDGDELPFTLFLPDLAGSAGLSLSVGPTSSEQTLTDTSSSGAVVTLASGTLVGHSGGLSTFTLRTGSLSVGHLPLAIPAVAGKASLTGRAVAIHPTEASFSPGAALSLPNDLELPATSSVDLFKLEPSTGSWVLQGPAAVDGGGTRITASGSSAIGSGGLYCFSTSIDKLVTVSGRIVDLGGKAVPGALVRGPQAVTRTASDGRFTLPDMAAVDGKATFRALTIEVNGGRDDVPARATKTVTAIEGAVDVGDLSLDTVKAGTVQVLLVTRGIRDPGQRMRISSAGGLGVSVAVGDAAAIAIFEDVEVEDFVGMLTTRIKDDEHVFRAAVTDFSQNERTRDLNLFSREVAWHRPRARGGDTRAVVLNKFGSGPIRDAHVIRGEQAGEGYVRQTREDGIAASDFHGIGTAALISTNGLRQVSSAFTMHGIDSFRIELPLERARRQRVGTFDRHGLFTGELTGVGAGVKTRRIRSHWTMKLEDWFEAVFLDRDEAAGTAPIKKLDGTSYLAGVPLPTGILAASEGTESGGVFTMERLGLVTDLRPDEGARTERDIDLNLLANTLFRCSDALEGLHATMSSSDLAFDYGIEFEGGRVVDVVRGVGGNHSVSDKDLNFSLPALTGDLAGSRHLVALQGEKTGGGKTIRQRTFVPFETGSAAVKFLGVPDITAPTPGQEVLAGGFAVNFTVPASTAYTTVQLRHETASEVRDWSVVLPPEMTTFTFHELPSQVGGQILAGSKAWSLTVTAHRIETGYLVRPDAYRRILPNWVGLTEAEREVNAFSSTTIQITTK